VKETPKHIHFLGIAGIGVSALAQAAQARGIRVSGSDPHADPESHAAIRRLQAGGAVVYSRHDAANLAADVDLVVASAAVDAANPEIRAAQARGIPVVSRAEALGRLMAAHRGPKFAVAGTHGKTTTTAMLGVILQHAGLDPTIFVGGEVAALGGNVRIGSETGPFVAEACEAYDSFLYLKPDIALLTNVEADHLDHFGTFDKVVESFRRFLEGVTPGSGKIIACMDDPGVRTVLEGLTSNPAILGYGLEAAEALSQATDIALGAITTFEWQGIRGPIPIRLQVPGRHNVLNALAAATAAGELGVHIEEIAAGLATFTGASRRQERLGEGTLDGKGGILVLDDYAHHPTEIRATLAALRGAYPGRRLVAAFQPHLYSRTRDFLPEFAEALAQADVVFVTDTYAAREAPIPDVDAEEIVVRIHKREPNRLAWFLPYQREIPAWLRRIVQSGDVVVFLGAGDIRDQGEAFARLLTRSKEKV
jgi:UDP-N-acetylmuramate--alanine ligase